MIETWLHISDGHEVRIGRQITALLVHAILQTSSISSQCSQLHRISQQNKLTLLDTVNSE